MGFNELDLLLLCLELGVVVVFRALDFLVPQSAFDRWQVTEAVLAVVARELRETLVLDPVQFEGVFGKFADVAKLDQVDQLLLTFFRKTNNSEILHSRKV